MDGLSRAIGAGAPVSLAGELYLLAPMTLGVIGAVENAMLLKRETPAESIRELVRATKDRRLRDHMIENARRELEADPLRRIVTHDQFQEYIDTDDGIVFTGWLCLRETERETFARIGAVRDAWNRSSEDEKIEFIKARNHSSGISLLCSLDWPDEKKMIPADVIARRDERRKKQGYHRSNWRLNFNRIGRNFNGMTLADLRSMTLYQYRMMCVDEKDLEQRPIKEIKPDEAGKTVRKQQIVTIGKGGPSIDELVRLGVAKPLSDEEQQMMAAASAAYRNKSWG